LYGHCVAYDEWRAALGNEVVADFGDEEVVAEFGPWPVS